MKTLMILILFSSLHCASSQGRGPDFSGLTAPEREENEREVKPKIQIRSKDRAPKGEIELGLEGDPTTETIIENGAAPPKDDTIKVDCEKTPDDEACKEKPKGVDSSPGELILKPNVAPESSP